MDFKTGKTAKKGDLTPPLQFPYEATLLPLYSLMDLHSPAFRIAH